MRTRVLTFLLCLAVSTGAFANATIIIQNADGTGVGFNDPTPAAPVGGNNGTTVGEQRLNAFNRAAEIWGKLIDSPVEIIISASFPALTCTTTTGTLGSAGATQTFANFDTAPLQNVWYPVALANKFAGRDLAPGQPDIRARFNRNLGQSGCLDSTGGWYYGFDGNHGTKQDLVVVLLHEFAHGLGFASFTDLNSGALFGSGDTSPMPNVFEKNMVDSLTGLRWDQLTNVQRVTASTNDQGLLWDGRESVRAAAQYLEAPGILRVNSPSSIAKVYSVGQASFGSKMTVAGVTASVAAAQDVAEPQDADPAGTATDGCSAYLNASEVVGRIVLVDRGRCLFVLKAQNAKAAGAIGLIIANNRTEPNPPGMAGTDRTINIPVVSVTQADGEAIRAALAQGVNATIGGDPTRPLAGTTEAGLLKLYAPTELSSGSSVSHWDTTTQPNTLMEPNISDDLSPESVDITLEQMLDIGWTATPKNPSGRRILKRGRN